MLNPLSIVVTCRNDNHGDGFSDRLNAFINGLDLLVRQHGYDVELIIVEWNPPRESAPLRDMFVTREKRKHMTIRNVIVPPEVHQRFQYWESTNIFQWMAKNIGIRRARGGFVLCTNCDILFSHALFSAMQPDRLGVGKLYRAVFYNVSRDILDLKDVDQMIQRACHYSIARHGARYRDDCFWKRYPFVWRFQPRACAGQGIDTDSCGDFTLMSKQDWLDIKGYPEIASHAYVDGFACHTAAALGKKQILLPEESCIYHIEHGGGWTTMDPMQLLEFCMQRPILDYAIYNKLVEWIRTNGQPLPLNRDDWGCANDEFDEYEY